MKRTLFLALLAVALGVVIVWVMSARHTPDAPQKSVTSQKQIQDETLLREPEAPSPLSHEKQAKETQEHKDTNNTQGSSSYHFDSTKIAKTVLNRIIVYAPDSDLRLDYSYGNEKAKPLWGEMNIEKP